MSGRRQSLRAQPRWDVCKYGIPQALCSRREDSFFCCWELHPLLHGPVQNITLKYVSASCLESLPQEQKSEILVDGAVVASPRGDALAQEASLTLSSNSFRLPCFASPSLSHLLQPRTATADG